MPYIVRIEHPVPSYEGWKQAFDADPIDREQSGVTRYRIVRDTADPSYVQIDLEFDETRRGRCVPRAAAGALGARVGGARPGRPGRRGRRDRTPTGRVAPRTERGAAQPVQAPPFWSIAWPVMPRASGESSHATVPATSSGWDMRRSGTSRIAPR